MLPPPPLTREFACLDQRGPLAPLLISALPPPALALSYDLIKITRPPLVRLVYAGLYRALRAATQVCQQILLADIDLANAKPLGALPLQGLLLNL